MRHKFPTRATRSRFLSGLAGIAPCLSATGAAAQSGGASELRLTLYFWIAGIEGTVGARWRGRLNRQWEFSVYGDVGGGGSKFSWQAAASANYEFTWSSLAGGWRYLYVDYDSSGFKMDAALSGPFVGATVRF